MKVETLLAIKKECDEAGEVPGGSANCTVCPFRKTLKAKIDINDGSISHELIEYVEIEISACFALVELLALPEPKRMPRIKQKRRSR